MNDAAICAHGRYITITWGGGGAQLLEVSDGMNNAEGIAELLAYLLKDKAALLLAATAVDLEGNLL